MCAGEQVSGRLEEWRGDAPLSSLYSTYVGICYYSCQSDHVHRYSSGREMCMRVVGRSTLDASRDKGLRFA